MKTALTILDEWIKTKMIQHRKGEPYFIGMIRGQISQLKEEEKRQIEQAYVSGFANSKTYETPEQYYEIKYNEQ